MIARLLRVASRCAFLGALLVAGSPPLAAQCVDFSKDPAGCQPGTFDTPMERMPAVRVNRQGQVDPTASEVDARAGAALLEEQLHLFRNFQHLHWVVTVPSVKDPATGLWKGGDMDGEGDGRGLAVAGNCVFVGHANGAGAPSRARVGFANQHHTAVAQPRR